MNRTRRAFLLGGGGIVVAAAGGLAWRASDQGVFSMGRGPAYAAWSAWPPKRDAGALSLVQAESGTGHDRIPKGGKLWE